MVEPAAPSPFREPAPPPPDVPVVPALPLAVRIGGAFLLLNALLSVAGLVLGLRMQSLPGQTGPAGGVGRALIDFALGAALIVGRANPGVVRLAMVRVALGGVLFAGLALSRREPVEAALQLVFSAGLLALLIGDAGRVRRALGTAVAAVVFGLGVFGLGALRVGYTPLQVPARLWTGDYARAGATLRGVRYHYRLALPRGWYLARPATAQRLAPTADRVVSRLDHDTHVFIAGQPLRADQTFDPEAGLRGALDATRRTGLPVEALRTSPLRGPDDDARVAEFDSRDGESGVPMRMALAVMHRGPEVLIATAAMPRAAGGAMRDEVLALLRGITLEPVDAPPVEREDDGTPSYVTAPGGEVRGRAFGYVMRLAPGWFVRSDGATARINAEVDRWAVRPYYGEEIFVIGEQLEAGDRVDLDGATEAVVAMRRERSPDFRLVGQEPLAGRADARVVTFEATFDGARTTSMVAIVDAGATVYQVTAVCPSAAFAARRAELLALLATFQPSSAP